MVTRRANKDETFPVELSNQFNFKTEKNSDLNVSVTFRLLIQKGRELVECFRFDLGLRRLFPESKLK